MAEMNVVEQVFQLPVEITSNGTVEKTLRTKNKYVDKDIKISITTPDATYEVETNEVPVAVASIATNNYTTETANSHPITLQANATKAASVVGVNQAGFAAADDTVTVPATSAVQATKTVYIKEGALGEDTAKASAEIVSDDVILTEGSTGDFVITANSGAGVKVTTGGWIDEGTNVETSDSISYNVQGATVTNSATADKTYVVGHSGAVVSGGYLYINEGYIKDTKISLAEIVPDEANIGVTTSNNLMYKTVTAYDKDGKLVTGSMNDATLGAITANNASATVDSVSVAFDETSSKFNVTGNHAISGTTSVAIATTGYATTDLNQSGTISGTANVDAEINVITIGADKAADGAVKPEIAKQTSTAKSTEILTVAPEDKHYVAVNTSAITASTVVTPTVTQEGYGDSTHSTKNTVTVTRGAEAAETVFIGINNGSVESTMSDVTKTAGVTTITDTVSITDGYDDDGVLDAAPTGGKPYITIASDASTTKSSFSGTVSTTVTEGYVVSGDAPTAKTVSGDIQVANATTVNKYIEVYTGEWV